MDLGKGSGRGSGRGGSDGTKPYYDELADDASLVPYYDGDIVVYGKRGRGQDDDDDDDDDDAYKKRNVNEDYEKYLKKLLKDANISFMNEKELMKSNLGEKENGGENATEDNHNNGSFKKKCFMI